MRHAIQVLSSSEVVGILRDFTRAILGEVGRCADVRAQCLEHARPTGSVPPEAIRHQGETRLAVRDAFFLYFERAISNAGWSADFDPLQIEPHLVELRESLLGR